MKNDHLLHRKNLKETQSDAINAMLCGARRNLRLILRHLRIFSFKIGQVLERYTALASCAV